MLDRRTFLKRSALAGGAMLLPWGMIARKAVAAPIPGGTLDPTTVPKYARDLVIPPAMPRTGVARGRRLDNYVLGVRQFRQEILPPAFPKTTVWSYGSMSGRGRLGTFNYPAFTIEARHDRPVRVNWVNDLIDPATGNFLPHLLPVDPTLHWANPPGGPAGRDSRPSFDMTPGPYTGPVPIVTHLHGGHSRDWADGYAEAWYLPAANDIPAGFATEGTWYRFFRQSAKQAADVDWDPGAAIFQYANDQRATTMWYHDHTLGMTRVNVYAGPAGFYLLRGGPDDEVGGLLPGPAPQLGDGPNVEYREIPIVIQDRSFDDDGSLFYPDTREFFDGFGGPYLPETPISPIWNPEFFANTMVVNGRTWPRLQVKRQRYRFRFLNGCNSRFLILRLSDPSVRFWQIGAEGGFLPEPVHLETLVLGPAERADVIVDFAEASDAEIVLENLGPDEPFKGFNAAGSLADGEGGELDPSDPGTTGQVMRFDVLPGSVIDSTTPPGNLVLPAITPIGAPDLTRQVSLNEEVYEAEDIPSAALLGTVDADGEPVSKMWSEPITEHVGSNATEDWEIFNFTEDAHPIHIHEVMFQVKDRRPVAGGAPIGPEPSETGFKDTVIAYPGEITRVRARFDISGLFVWHCHIVEHEDNEMMRPYFIGDPSGYDVAFE